MITSLLDLSPTLKEKFIKLSVNGESAEVRILEMCGKRHMSYVKYLKSLPESSEFSALVWVIFSAVDEEGNQINSIDELDSIEQNLPLSVQSELISAAKSVNGFDKAEESLHQKKDD